MNLKAFALLVSAPVWLPLLAVVALLGAIVAIFATLTDEECLESGIVPARRRNDRDFVARVRDRATGGEG